ncbi:Wzz/FepE/Etk N-terminal domain-containing protein [Pseudomonas aeruginosa]
MTEKNFPSYKAKSGEFDLIEIMSGLWSLRWLIALLAVLPVLLAIVYLFITKPVYEARVSTLPPSLSDIAGFNLGRSENGLPAFSANGVYSIFVRNLQSEETRRQFFRDVYIPSLEEGASVGSRDQLYALLMNSVTIQKPSKEDSERYTVVIERHDPSQAAEWGEKYIGIAVKRSMQEMQEGVRREFQVKNRNIQQQIDILRETAKARREDRISRLKEALRVAEALKLENPPLIEGQVDQQLSSIMEGGLMYMRGAKAIRAEIKTLQDRVSDDPFIPALRGLQEKYALLEGLTLNLDKVAVFRQDGTIEVPDDPVRPRKGIVLILSMLAGGFLGVAVALAILMVRGGFRRTIDAA